MTLDALSGKATGSGFRTRRRKVFEPLAIGEVDADIFNCPACARPLGVGAARCPGCGTRLIGGVQAKRAMAFLGLGWVMGAMIGAVIMGGYMLATRPTPIVAEVESPVVLPSAAPVASAPVSAGAAAAIDPRVPSAVLSALRQTAILDDRIAGGAERLAAALALGDTPAMARAMRALSADAASGDRFVAGLAGWSASETVAADLATFYTDIGSMARGALSASLTNGQAYRAAAESILAHVDTLSALDGAIREVAADAGLELPPGVSAAAP